MDIKIQIYLDLPNGDKLRKTLEADSDWRKELEPTENGYPSAEEYTLILLHRSLVETMRWARTSFKGDDSVSI